MEMWAVLDKAKADNPLNLERNFLRKRRTRRFEYHFKRRTCNYRDASDFDFAGYMMMSTNPNLLNIVCDNVLGYVNVERAIIDHGGLFYGLRNFFALVSNFSVSSTSSIIKYLKGLPLYWPSGGYVLRKVIFMYFGLCNFFRFSRF